jgi:hypothetical protein
MILRGLEVVFDCAKTTAANEGFRLCVRTYSLKGTGFSPYINDAM